MFNGRSIPNELWAKARQRLIFYFSRRLGIQNAEDLAHNTLLAIWIREDYTFEKEEDFLRVCHGFAKKILQEGYRESLKDQGCVELTSGLEHKILDVKGLKGPEATAFLEEVKRCGVQMFEAEEWALIETAIKRSRDDPAVTGKTRIRLHRIRKKLAEVTGWKRD